MEVAWTRGALNDLGRLHDFLAVTSERVAHRRYVALIDAPLAVLSNPRLGPRVDDIREREVRRLIVGGYELRYEVRGDVLIVLRLWHTREDR